MKVLRNSVPTEEGVILDIPLKKDMDYVGLKVHKLEKGKTIEGKAKVGEELCVVIVTGFVNAQINDNQPKFIGNRMSVFVEESPYALYITSGDTFKVEAATDVEVAICYAPGVGTYHSRFIEPNPDAVEKRGYGQIQRTAKNILPETDDADGLLVVEVITTGGNWSSFPSHRHDEDDLPNQSFLEEIYYHKLNPEEGGFAFQRVYNDDKSVDEAYVIENESSVLVKEGYHPVSVPPGYDLYYLNVMAGPKRTWKFYNDPYFEHLIK